jgi:5-methyltetrahydropteroyltriglutamate--homocysteine methyltransferase
MTIPTEPIGSVPRPAALQAARAAHARGEVDAAEVERHTDAAVRDTLARFEATGSPIVTDGEQGKSSFVTYPLEGVTSLAPDGISIPFADGHTRRLPRLTAGPFRFGRYAGAYTTRARALTARPLKQAVISASALSLLYPADGIAGYPREAFLDDLVAEAEADIRGAFAAGAEVVQVDFTEGRLAAKLDPSLGLLRSFVALNNRVLDRFDDRARAQVGVHTCPGGDHDSTHSADVDYAHLLPSLFQLHVGRYYVQLASERDRPRVLRLLREHLRPGVRVFVGVTDPIDARVESPAEVRDRVLEAASILPIDQLGTTDDCGFAPFADDTSTARETAFAKIRARVEGTALASQALGA